MEKGGKKNKTYWPRCVERWKKSTHIYSRIYKERERSRAPSGLLAEALGGRREKNEAGTKHLKTTAVKNNGNGSVGRKSCGRAVGLPSAKMANHALPYSAQEVSVCVSEREKGQTKRTIRHDDD